MLIVSRRSYRFLVVDDHPVFRQGLVALIESVPEYEVAVEAGSAEEALAKLESAAPDIALVDISLVRKSGLDLASSIHAAHREVKVLIVSMHDEIIYAARALKAGAQGYVMKQEPASVMLEAIRTVLAGEIYLSGAMRERLVESADDQEDTTELVSVDRLTNRELEVLELTGQGYGAGEIAERLNLSVRTVNAHRDHLKEKLQMDGAGDLRRFAVKWVQSRNR
jgi:DNA-binding NarL/FixJ family response regulator